MNPQQDNNQANMNGQQPQGQAEGNFDGFGGPNISYANYDDKAVQQQQQAQQQEAAPVPMNVVDVVNANGVVSGRKVVDYVWQRGAICLMVLAAGLLVGLALAVFLVVNKSSEVADLKRDKEQIQAEVNSVYTKMGVNDLSGAITQLDARETLNGGDLDEINRLLVEKYNADFKLDLADSNINFVIRNGVYKVVSLGIHRNSGTVRAVLYEKIADGKWVRTGFDASKPDPCQDLTDADKAAIDGIIPCEVQKDDKK